MRVKPTEVRRLTEAAFYRYGKRMKELEGSTNPQEQDMYQRAKAAADVYLIVNRALWGDLVELKIDAGM